MKKMNANEMREVNGGFWLEAAIGWMIGRAIGKTIASWRR